MIFSSNLKRTEDYKRRGETAFKFLDRSSWLISELIRGYTEEWLLPFKPDAEFLKMVKSKSDKQHYSAMFELMSYTLLKKSGFTLTRHPSVATRSKPDFYVEGKGISFFVECTLAGHSFETIEDKNRKDAVEDIIERHETYPYFVNMTFRVISKRSISKKHFLHFLSEVEKLSVGLSDLMLKENKHIYEDNGWKIEISLIRKSHGGIKRSLGMIMDNAKTIDSSKPIITSLSDKKASKYGIKEDPYVIFLNTNDLFTSEDSFSEALLGQYCRDTVNLELAQNSFFYAESKPINTSVSAVVIFRNLDLFTIGNSSVVVWHNPFAKNPISPGFFPFKEYGFEIKGLHLVKQEYEPKIDIFEILEIDKDKYLSVLDKRTE